MCSVVTNLVTSLEFLPIRCATMLCHFGRTRNGYLATRFILLKSTAESSATSGYVVAPERQSEARAGRNVEQTWKKTSFVPSSELNRCNLYLHVYMSFSSFYMYFFLYFFLINAYHFPLLENLFDLLFISVIIMSARD